MCAGSVWPPLAESIDPASEQIAAAQQILRCIDLTSLGESDDRGRIIALCAQAASPYGSPAAICVYPEWIDLACTERQRLGLTSMAIASVADFPDGSGNRGRIERECHRAVAAGADEIDVVMPWRALIEGRLDHVRLALRTAREATVGKILKVILESGELTSAQVQLASELVLQSGADFLKTSTGKRAIGATPAAACIMLEVLREHGGTAGFKAAGGIRTLASAIDYLRLAQQYLGAVDSSRFRIGASALWQDVIDVLDSAR
ncbi:MAG: deoxyribose-phosphate aldolase [Xanthomonadales bacterium]|nr:deoxyribose-phosphate aldolase [Xanthomonadales bacterium]